LYPSDNNKRRKFERCNQEPKGPKKKAPKKKDLSSTTLPSSHTNKEKKGEEGWGGVQKDSLPSFLPSRLTHSLQWGFEKARKSLLILTHDKKRESEEKKSQKHKRKLTD
jgi:hypothetical protein